MTEKTISEIKALLKKYKDTGHKLIVANNKLSKSYIWFRIDTKKHNENTLLCHDEVCKLIIEYYLSFIDKKDIGRILYTVEGQGILINEIDVEAIYIYDINSTEKLTEYGICLNYDNEPSTKLYHPQEINSIINHLDALDKICKVFKPIAYSLMANTKKTEVSNINKYSLEASELSKYINNLDKDSVLSDRFSKLLCNILADTVNSNSKVHNALEKLDAINKNSKNIFHSLIFWRKLKNILDLDSENCKDV